MRYLHTMLRVTDLASSIEFYCAALGLVEVKRLENASRRLTLVLLAAPSERIDTGGNRPTPTIELTHSWAGDSMNEDRFFGHLAFEVDDIYATCTRLQAKGVTVNRPPRDRQMALVPRRIVSRSSSFRRASLSLRINHGYPCPILGRGSPTACR